MQIVVYGIVCGEGSKLDYLPVQPVDESVPGWVLAKKKLETSSAPWLVYAGFGVMVTGLVASRHGLPRLLLLAGVIRSESGGHESTQD
jgi:hypothetical protein